MCIKYGVGCCLLFGWRGKGNTCVSSNSGSHTPFLYPKTAAFKSYKCHKQLSFLTQKIIVFDFIELTILKRGYKFQVIA